MAWATDPINIIDEKISISTYGSIDRDAIAAAINDPDGWNGRNWGWNSPDTVARQLQTLIDGHDKNLCNPLVYRVGDEVAGVTRYMRIEASNRSLEIGGTAVAPKWRRTFVNTHVKHLLLKHAFEQLGAERVEFRVDCRNFASQLNVLRIGAGYEGRLRARQLYPDGQVRDGYIYSVCKSDWPRQQERLMAMRAGIAPQPAHLPFALRSPRLQMRLLKLHDAPALLQFARDNHALLHADFPSTAQLASEDEARSYIAEDTHDAYAGRAFYYGAFLGDQLIGQLDIKHIDWKLRSTELGYCVALKHQRRGYGSEMIAAAMSHLGDFRRVAARARPDNSASIALIEKMGFTREGVHRSAFLAGDGAPADIAVYARTM